MRENMQKFLFQTGSIRSGGYKTCIYLFTNVFLFQTGSIRSDAIMSEAIRKVEFLFQTGSIRRGTLPYGRDK